MPVIYEQGCGTFDLEVDGLLSEIVCYVYPPEEGDHACVGSDRLEGFVDAQLGDHGGVPSFALSYPGANKVAQVGLIGLQTEPPLSGEDGIARIVQGKRHWSGVGRYEAAWVDDKLLAGAEVHGKGVVFASDD